MMSIVRFKKIIWDYYRTEGRKLAWRETRDPYRILVSEIMLQQTQVSRVSIKYEEFIRAFPTFRALANASVSNVLRAWQGLGYNRRALSLKKIAERVISLPTKKLPNTVEGLLALPGIGPGTAGSLSAFVFNKPVPFIETNIRRVFLHFFFPLREHVGDVEILPLVQKTIDAKNPREWYYALMDYGAMLGRIQKLENPNRRSKHYAVQSKFEGSNRALRGTILKMVLRDKRVSMLKLQKAVRYTPQQVAGAIRQLVAEGFVKKSRATLQPA